MTETHMGRCYCGAVEIEVRGDPLEMGYCHCENCQRYSAARWKFHAVDAGTLATATRWPSRLICSRAAYPTIREATG